MTTDQRDELIRLLHDLQIDRSRAAIKPQALVPGPALSGGKI